MIAVQSRIYDRLASKGKFGESINNLLSRILDDVEGKENGHVRGESQHDQLAEVSQNLSGTDEIV